MESIAYINALQAQATDLGNAVNRRGAELSEAKKRLLRLLDLQEEIGGWRKGFESAQDQRRSVLFALKSSGVDSRIAVGYCQRMESVVNGNSAFAASDSFTHTLKKLADDIEETRLRISHLTRLIDTLRADENHLRQRIDRLEQEG